MKIKDNTELFTQTSIHKAVLSLAVPTVISQLITVVYNMADTFFIGQLGDPVQVAASILAMPPFIFLTGIANLFGIGGASMIARCLGKKDPGKASLCAGFAIWSAAGAALIYGLLFTLLRPVILPLIGTTEQTYEFCYQYMFWTVTIGALPTVMNAVLAHLIRTEGCAGQASLGMTMGCVLNIILDPLFILVLGMEIKGAAIATLLSNCIAFVYFILLIRSKGGNTCISAKPRREMFRGEIAKEILLVGMPSFVMVLMSFLSNTTLNSLVSSYSSEAVAGMGIAKKADMIGFAVAQGMTQGVLSLIAYNYAAGRPDKMKKAIRIALLYSIALALTGSILLYLFALPVSRMFIKDAETVAYSTRFIRALCLSLPLSSIIMMVITVFQASGRKIQPMVLSMLRKGGLDIPFMLLLRHFAGVFGIAYATPLADVVTLVTALLLFVPCWKDIQARTGSTR